MPGGARPGTLAKVPRLHQLKAATALMLVGFIGCTASPGPEPDVSALPHTTAIPPQSNASSPDLADPGDLEAHPPDTGAGTDDDPETFHDRETLPPEPPLVDDLDTADLGNDDCEPPSPHTSAGRFSETRATPNGIDASALFYVVPPWRSDQEVKVIWRVTGSGEGHFVAIDPEGGEHPPTWGPNRHRSSSYNRPGDEWGTAFSLPTEGCWELRVTRDEGTASIWVIVQDS